LIPEAWGLKAEASSLEASPEKPYLSMILRLDPALITQILAELPEESIDEKKPAGCFLFGD